MERPISIYCDWALHDELGDNVELDEALTFRALDTLAHWQQQHGLAFDYYVLDAFWFDPHAPYTAFKQPHWPHGFDRALARIRELGMAPGLWYDVTGSFLDVEAWKPSYDPARRAHSLAYGPYGASLEAGWRHALERWGVRLFKLDFANFHAAPPAWDVSPWEAYQANTAALRAILGRLRREYPDLVVLAYNGIERWPGYISRAMGAPAEPGFDLSWLEVFDYVYSGDPRPSDLIRTDLRRSIDAFQDHAVWLLAQGGFPFERIDDHGCMVGRTNTIFYQGAHGFRRSFLAHLARGGRRALFYGDPLLLSEDEAAFMLRCRDLFFDAFRCGLSTHPVGGEPGVAPWHGFLTGGASRGLLYLVNGSCTSQQVALPLPGLAEAHVLFADAGAPVVVQVNRDRLSVQLAPEQLALVGLGTYAQPQYELGLAADAALPQRMELLPLTWRQVAEERFAATWQGAVPANAQLFVAARALVPGDPPARGLEGLGWPVRFGQQMTNASESSREPSAHAQVAITVTADGTPVQAARRLPDVPIWAGISWVGKLYAGKSLGAGKLDLSVQQRLEPRRELEARAYWVWFE